MKPTLKASPLNWNAIAAQLQPHRSWLAVALLLAASVPALVQIPHLQAQRRQLQDSALALQNAASAIAALQTRAAERQTQEATGQSQGQTLAVGLRAALAQAAPAAQIEQLDATSARLTLPAPQAAQQLGSALAAAVQSSPAQVRHIAWTAGQAAHIELSIPAR